MKHFILSLFLLFSAIPAFAQEPVQEEQDETLLMIKAVILSGHADAHNVYCEKDAGIAARFIKTFQEKRGLNDEQAKQYTELSAKVQAQTLENIKSYGKPCSDLEVMMSQLEVMKELRNVSYLLNGIDPKTVPMNSDMPNLEDLFPSQIPETTPAP